ncbi:uncharacterized protein RAG0_04122 [Rhynchosporium agropyri]|uniref:Uncharacterized protein n=1 Tax=Rhynchosporium agropyri TaxID=914238 RepID=A0A1E1K854_9HELO|nr:uncharacterized protein RAG0_04122 [Rhynchosporium agropyri]
MAEPRNATLVEVLRNIDVAVLKHQPAFQIPDFQMTASEPEILQAFIQMAFNQGWKRFMRNIEAQEERTNNLETESLSATSSQNQQPPTIRPGHPNFSSLRPVTPREYKSDGIAYDRDVEEVRSKGFTNATGQKRRRAGGKSVWPTKNGGTASYVVLKDSPVKKEAGAIIEPA